MRYHISVSPNTVKNIFLRNACLSTLFAMPVQSCHQRVEQYMIDKHPIDTSTDNLCYVVASNQEGIHHLAIHSVAVQT